MGIPAPLVRVNQAFQVIFAATALITGQYLLLLIPLINGIIALAAGRNPIILAARPFLRRPPSSYTPMDPDQQRFNQWIAVICLALALIGLYVFQSEWTAFIFTAMVGVAAFVALLGFCVGCWIRFQWVRYRHNHRKAS